MWEDVQAFALHVRRHRWWYASGTLHLLLLGVLYWHGPYQIQQRDDSERQQLAQDYVAKAYRQEMDRRLNDMREIETLMARIQESQQVTKTANENNTDISPALASELEQAVAQTHARDMKPEQPLSLAEQAQRAQEIAKHIRQSNLDLRAETLAELMKVPVDEARERLREETTLPEFSEEELAHLSEDSLRQHVENLHRQSREELRSVVEQAERQRDGLSLSPDALGGGMASGTGSGGQSKGSSNAAGNRAAGNGESGGESHDQGNLAGGGGALGDAAQYLANHNSRSERGDGGTASGRPRYEGGVAIRPAELGAQPRLRVRGRTVGSGGAAVERMFVDSWYIIGPFPYRGRQMRDQPHPPELAVDLNATYPGKGGRYVQWHYYQESGYPLVPPRAEGDATYYGYTELRFEEDTTLWLSLGCDDDCKLWIDEQAVWRSGEAHKPWYAHGGYESLGEDMAHWSLIEEYRPHTFRRGTHRLLFRLDNGYSLLFFALHLERSTSHARAATSFLP